MQYARGGGIRNAGPADLSRLCELERLCWSEELRIPKDVLAHRLVANPHGQFVVEAEDEIWGVIYSQRILSAEALYSVGFDHADRLRSPEGGIAHVLSLNVDPARRNFEYGDALLEHLLTWYGESGAVRTVVGVTRCKDYRKHAGIELADYVKAVNADGRCVDTVLRMHQLHGAEVRGLVPRYRPGDLDNNGNGVLVEYDLRDRRERMKRFEDGAAQETPSIPHVDRIGVEVSGFLEDLLGGGVDDEVADRLLESPLFQLGLDSADLLEFQAKIEKRYGVQLPPLFFFDHDTGAKIVSRLGSIGTGEEAAKPARTESTAPCEEDDSQDVAIIGMACRFPGGIDHYTDLWDLLAEGGTTVGPLPEGRWRWPEAISPKTHPGIDRGGFVKDVDRFEAGLFRISPHEAQRMDPQQRWMLELTWACLEDAGYRASAVAGAPIGVFIGASGSDYQRVADSQGLPVHAHSGLATSMAIIANRVSYFYDLRGPSIQVDTACSSSLVAVHSAVRALREGDCDAALIGGVNVLCHPADSVAYHQAGMLSPDGLCKTFDESADGYVRAEGGVVLLLKRLSRALADGDPVHAVVKGTATNHGGQASGLTVPSADMQASLISAALADARITPERIDYVEAHGTGTALGDPIEVQGLAQAFAGSTTPCGLGSLKTNLGHLEAAAGIAGVVKTVLSLQNGALPVSLHFKKLNPRITLEDSPFFVVEKSRAWHRVDGRSRLAGVSSFGSGGSNAHVIVGEAPAVAPREAVDTPHPPMVVLSAATEEQLLRQAELLCAHLERRRLSDADLVDLAYTLQVGREPLRERLALLPTGPASLESLLEDAVHGRAGTAILRGSAKKNRPGDQTAGARFDDGQHRVLLEAWVDGAEVDWEQLHLDRPAPRRVPLPTHVFAGKRHWLSGSAQATGPGREHALTGQEPFLLDHRVRSEKVLPAVVHLEMARAAVMDLLPPSDAPLSLENVVWSRPVVVGDESTTVYTTVEDGADGRVSFEIRSRADGQDVLHSRGTGLRGPSTGPSFLDVEALMSRMTRVTLGAADCYDALRAAGLDYGPTHRTLREVYLGDGELLATIRLPDATQPDRAFHPGLLDGALQVVYGPEIHRSAAGRWTAALPFTLDSFEVLGRSPASAYVWAREMAGTPGGGSRWDLDLSDDDGTVFARLRGYSLRGGTAPTQDVSLFRPTWSERPASAGNVEYAAHFVLACGFGERLAELRGLVPQISFREPPESARSIPETLAAHAVELMQVVKGVLLAKPAGPTLIQVLASTDTQTWARALSGLLKSAHVENPNVLGQVVVASSEASARYLVDKLVEDSRSPGDREIRHSGESRQVRRWEPLAGGSAASDLWRTGGVYLVTGGAGGLGVIFAEELARCAPNATLVLTGRSPLDPVGQARLHPLRAAGARVEYHVLDVADERGTTDLVADLKQRLGGVHGVIHNAGVLHDSFLLTKTVSELTRVLTPKVNGCLNLDKALKDEQLDFFVLSSSVMGSIGNVGQADYAVANAFLDGFAWHREELVRLGRRSGRTVAIDWSLWQSGGMAVDTATRTALQMRTGMIPLSTPDGLGAFHRVLASGEPQVLVAAGQQDRLREYLDGGGVGADVSTAAVAGDADDRALVAEAVRFLKQALSTSTGLPVAEIDEDQVLGDYGMDSILATELIVRLEASFASLPKTLFFEYHTLSELGRYFAAHHRHTLEEMFTRQDRPAATRMTEAGGTGTEPVRTKPARTLPARDSAALDIAVIGISGRYPESRNLREYWQNLRDGRDCIVEVPGDRWDWREHYTEDRDRPGRHYSKWGGFIAEVDRFDPLFFNISPYEAEHLDPQERLFLEHAWTAMEDAGYTRADLRRPDGIAGRVGVYAGAMWNQYQLLFAGGGNPSAVGSSFASVANRVSFVLDLHGPSMTVDTMCSSSLTAVELACRDLAQGRTKLAFAGGVNVTVHPNKYLSLSTGQFISSKGHCESFGRGGDGYIPGEGVGVVLLKPLADAEYDGDHVYGVIKGSGVSHGGRTNGYTVPNPRAQETAIRSALAEAGVDPRAVSYIEAHGTGTTLGDPIEISGLDQVFGRAEDGQRCYIGSAKSNIGHCESAAGIAGLTKVLLQLQHGRITPSLHSATLNPNIDFSATPFVVNQVLRDWQRPVVNGQMQPRIAGVSSFGAGGSNAHLVVAEYIGRRAAAGLEVPVLIPLSAKNEDRLRAYATELLCFVREQNVALMELAFTLQVGREAMDERLGIVTGSAGDLAWKLQQHLDGTTPEGLFHGNVKRDKEALLLLPAEELAETIDRMLERGMSGKLLKLWVRGAVIDWRRLYSGNTPARISAPTYPFARERYWVSQPARSTAVPSTAAQSTAIPSTVAHPIATGRRVTRFLDKAWKPAPLGDARTECAAVVILHDRTTTEKAGVLAELFDDATLVQAVPGAAERYRLELESCSAWVDLTGITEHGVSAEALSLLQIVLESGASRGVRLLFVTQGLEAFGTEQVNLAGASRAGLYRMLQSEYSRVTSRHLDLDPGERRAAELAAVVHRELAGGDEVEVCHRNGVRFAAVLEDVAPGESVGESTFGADRVLLVTGGTRGLGLLCARHLVERRGVRKLVLTGRKPLPPRSSWADPGVHTPVMQEKIRAVEELEARGVEVRVLAPRLERADEVRAAIEDVEATMGPIAGFVHAAGLVDTRNPAFVRKLVADIAEVVSPKIEGTRNLLSCLDPRALEFVLLFSSVSSVVPTLGAGQSDYAMGNAFLDYAARATGVPVTSVQWPSWRDTGFGEVTNRAYTDTGLLSLADEEGLALLDDVLATRRSPVVMPVVVDPHRFDAEVLMRSRLDKPEPVPTREPVAAPADGEKLTAFLAAAFEAELKLKPGQLEENTSYADYGADSILLVQVLQRIKQRLGVPLDPSALLGHPTLAELAAWLRDTYPAEVAERFGAARAEPVAGEAESDRAPKPAAPTPARPEREAVTVIGMACRFPGAPDVDAYWELLSQGRSVITEVPETRWGVPTGFHAGLVDTACGFDPEHFLLHPEDVQAMDPQALVLLEECLKAVHHAGYRPEELRGSITGVYVGARSGPRPDAGLVDRARNPIMTVGQNYLAANISQFFDWQGPAMVLDTACSSSLVAMKVATDALMAGSVDLAVVAGVSLLTNPADHELFRRRGLLREDGRFHIFDRRASGVVLGEGAGVVVLKPLSQARRDGDTVYALIEGIAVNNDGRTAGPATPNVRAQRRVMRAALDQAGCAPEEVRHLDVNGSGSETTDLLELKAIEAVYRDDRSRPLYLGSMKPNIGHPLCAEGVAAFIKVALMVHHQRLVPFLSATEPLEHFAPDRANLVFPRRAEDADLPHAAVSSFADGGTNAHVILGRAPAEAVKRRPLDPPPGAAKVREPEAVLSHGFTRSKVWRERIDPRHPVVANHRVYGQRLLPGLAWIDLLYQWFAEIGVEFDTLELRDLALHRPLVVESNAGQEIRVVARPDIAGAWRIEVIDPALPGAPPYVTAEMRRGGRTTFDERAPVEAIGGPGAQDLEPIYRRCRERELIHTGLMKACGTAHAGGGEIWLSVALDERETDGSDDYLFHPALIDGSAVAATAVAAGLPEDESRLFLPLFYESFRVSAPLRRVCRTRVRRSSIVEGTDLLTFTLEFFDTDGRKVGELANFRSKLVRHAGLIDPSRRESAPIAAAPPAIPADSLHALVTSTVAVHLGVPASAVIPTSSYYEMGLDSARLLQVVKDLEQALETRLSPTLLFEHTTVAALTRHLSETYAPVAYTQAAHVPPAEPREPSGPWTGDIAIIGISGRYPKADSVAKFWENLKAGRDCVTEVPESRWSRNQLDGVRSPSGRAMSRWGGFVDDADCFDAEFFDVPAAEAALLDPQERLFLQTCWEAMEDAGYTPANVVEEDSPRRAVGVYVGVMHKDYVLVQDEAAKDVPLSLNPATIANRVSHFCDFHGPSMAVDTVCASSLSAVHLAVEGIRRGECAVALAGGVNLSLHPGKYRTYGLLDLHASDGPPRSFGAGGDGYVSAEGSGAVLLKPLERALADGDAVYAVIKGSAVNHAGRTAGIRVPSAAAQQALVTDCLDRAGVDPRSISYVEAHGTGTELGDLIELQALDRAFRARTDDTGFCALGSVKSGIGHAESAAGISALTSATLQLHHRMLVPLLPAEVPNPYLDLDDSPFYLQTRLREWTTDGATPRRAGVSAFGATGAYAHVVLEEAPPVPDGPVETTVPGGVLISLSATNQDRLSAYAGKLLRFLDGQERVDLPSLAYTLQTGRVALVERVVLLAHSLDEVTDALRVLARGDRPANAWSGRVEVQPGTMLLDEDDLRQELVRRWSAQGRPGKIAELWVQGYEVSWRELYARTPRRAHLPTYPFARDRHWVSATGPVTGAEQASLSVLGTVPDTVQHWRFVPHGEPLPPGPSSVEPEEKARQYLRQLVGARLGRPTGEIGPHTGFLELGLTSLGIVGLTRDLAATVDPGFLPSTLFEHDTIAALAAYLVDWWGPELARLVTAPTQAADPPGVLEVLERLEVGALDLDDAIALLDRERTRK